MVQRVLQEQRPVVRVVEVEVLPTQEQAQPVN
jgi:hypothetical protein